MNKPGIKSIVDKFSATQRKIYLLLAACGSLPAGNIAKRLELPRSTVSKALNCLYGHAILDRVVSGRLIIYSIDYKEVEFLEDNLNKNKPEDKEGRWNC
ncbi:hypothetical protein [Coleofasciculus sp. E2-BRE-01]|uniref:hypothetical protein n=1 Tax=Coleofasciculus sp. E2-BRE-01 TaxID=3069524 RepID=UPI0032F24516